MDDSMAVVALGNTAESMIRRDYSNRSVVEHSRTKIRYEKLKAFCNKIEDSEIIGNEPPKHDLPLSLLRQQQKYMGQHLYDLCSNYDRLLKELACNNMNKR